MRSLSVAGANLFIGVLVKNGGDIFAIKGGMKVGHLSSERAHPKSL